MQLSASNLRVLVSRLRARISSEGTKTVTAQTEQRLGGLSVDYSVAAFSSQRYFAVNPVDLQWQDSALCVQTDPEMFYPEKGGSTREAKRVCQSCEVRKQCLEHALKNDEHFGIWGGKTPGERKRLKRRP